MANNDVEFDTRGFAKDIEYGKSKTNKDNNGNNLDDSCGSITGFISKIQEISVQESLLDGSIDKNLFTLQKTLCALKNGFNLGIATATTIILHILFCFIFSFEFLIDFFTGKEIPMLVFKYFPAIVTIAITIYISNLSKYAVGDFTAKAIKTFYIGKMVSTMIAGMLIFSLVVYLNIMLKDVHINQSFEYAKIVFNSNIRTFYFNTIVLILISSFLPFLFYGFRKIFFTSNEQSEYDKY